MKSIIWGSIILTTIIVVNVYVSLNTSLANFPLFNTEALALGEGSGGSKTYFQITAGCRNYAMENWINRCCEGASPSCIRDRCNYAIVEGCDKCGLRDISF